MNKILIGLICIMGLGWGLTFCDLMETEELLTEYEISANAAIKLNEEYLEEIDQLNARIDEILNYRFTREEKFKIAASVYDVDFNMLYAIAKLETGNFTSGLFVNNNNPGGMRGSSGWMSFDSEFEGIMEMARLLRYYYLDQGLTTLEEIGSKYCPDTAENWAGKVRSLME